MAYVPDRGHMKSLDWRARKAKKKGEVGEEVLAEVVGKLGALIF